MVWESEKEKNNFLTEHNFENEEAMLANGANEFKSNIIYIKSESLIYLGKEVNVDEIEEDSFNYYTINKKRVLTIYNDSSMTEISSDGSYFSKDYTKFYFKYDLNEKGTTYALITFSCK